MYDRSKWITSKQFSNIYILKLYISTVLNSGRTSRNRWCPRSEISISHLIPIISHQYIPTNETENIFFLSSSIRKWVTLTFYSFSHALGWPAIVGFNGRGPILDWPKARPASGIFPPPSSGPPALKRFFPQWRDGLGRKSRQSPPDRTKLWTSIRKLKIQI